MVHLHKGSYRYTHTQKSSVLCCCCGMPHCRCPWRCFMTMCCTVASACLVVVAVVVAAELRSLLLLLHVLWPFSFLARKFVATCLEFRMRRCRLSCAQTKQNEARARLCTKKFTSVQRGVYLTCERGVYVCVCWCSWRLTFTFCN